MVMSRIVVLRVILSFTVITRGNLGITIFIVRMYFAVCSSKAYSNHWTDTVYGLSFTLYLLQKLSQVYKRRLNKA